MIPPISTTWTINLKVKLLELLQTSILGSNHSDVALRGKKISYAVNDPDAFNPGPNVLKLFSTVIYETS